MSLPTSPFKRSRWQRLRCVTIATGAIVTVGVAITAAVQRDKIAFVVPCMQNGNAYRDCACTHAALPRLPAAYRPVAQAWAHSSSYDHANAVATFVGGEAKQAILNQLPSLPIGDPRKLDPSKLKAWIMQAGSVAALLKASAASNKTVPPVLILETANDLTSNLVKARAAYSATCGGTVNRMFAVYDGLKTDIAKTASDVGVGSVKEAAGLATAAKKAVTNAGAWVSRTWDSWRK